MEAEDGSYSNQSSDSSTKSTGRDPTQTQPRLNPDGTISTWTYDHNRATKALCRFIAVSGLPLDFGESTEFENYIRKTICPQFQKVTKKAIIDELVKSYKAKRVSLKNEMGTQNNNYVALTYDIWRNAMVGDSYLSVVAHFIDDNWEMQKRILGFKFIVVSPENIADVVLSVARVFNLRDRIISVTFDDVAIDPRASLTGFVIDNDAFLHQQCACHVINAIVKSGIELLEPCLDIIREAINFLSVDYQDCGDFSAYCVEVGEYPRQFVLDNPTKWNSTYFMLKNIVPYKRVVTAFVNLKKGSVFLEESHWTVAEFLLQVLEVFYDSAVSLSGVYSLTSSLALHMVLEITDVLVSHKTDPLLLPSVLQMEASLKKYWTDIPNLYSFGFILDPRIKIDGLYNILTHLGSRLGLDYTEIFTNARDKFYEVYRIYESKFRSLRDDQEQSLEAEKRGKKRNSSWACIFPNSSSKPEMDRYLETNCSFDSRGKDFDVLDWWRRNRMRFPILSRLARDVLAVPASTVSSESAFEVEGKVLEERMSLWPIEVVEIVTCVKDWEEATTRKQHTAHNEDLVADFENLYIHDEHDLNSTN